MLITARFLPSPCQVYKYSRDVLSAVAKHDGRLPRPWTFTKGGLAVSARYGVFNIKHPLLFTDWSFSFIYIAYLLEL